MTGLLGRWGRACCFLCLAACASAPPLRSAGLPTDARTRRESIDQLSRTLFEAMRQSNPQGALADASEVDDLLVPEGRLRVERERSSQERAGSDRGPRALWSGASYAGFCAQGARQEPARAALGLKEEGWVLQRVLVVAAVGARRSAAWVEGRFVYTDQGWKALSFTRLEQPRAHHADLELAPCDVEHGIR